MKVLFAVSNESISEAIVKSYQKQYKEIISYKNVYYFNAILKEIQKDKTYDRIVISEDLEPFSNNNYSAIDRFLFEKLDSISDEATQNDGNEMSIILICSDRRNTNDSILNKLFGIGIYNAILGQDRSIDKVCELVYKPRNKKGAKTYYKLDTDNVNYETENESDVSEQEMQNILKHYKQLGRQEDKFVQSFNSIASQYTESQLRLIAKLLPTNVKKVLEQNSEIYIKVVTFDPKYVRNKNVKPKAAMEYPNTMNSAAGIRIDTINTPSSTPTMSGDIVIPGAMNINNNSDVEDKVFETLNVSSIENETNNNQDEETFNRVEDYEEDNEPKRRPRKTEKKSNSRRRG